MISNPLAFPPSSGLDSTRGGADHKPIPEAGNWLLGFDWNDLKFFLAIHRAGSLNGAATRLKVQHSTVSRRLQAMEESLGAALFSRRPEGLVLTAAGEAVLPHATRAEEVFEALQNSVAGQDQRIEGTVRVTASQSMTSLVVRHLGALHERHPGLVVELLTGDRAFDLLRGEADVAIRHVATSQTDLIARRCPDVAWSLYAAQAYVERRGVPANAADLAGHDIIGFGEPMDGSPGAAWLREHAPANSVVMRGNGTPAVLSAALTAMGVAALPCFMCDVEPTLRRLTSETIASGEAWLVFRPDLTQVARVRCVIDFLVATIAENADLIGGRRSRFA